MAQQNAAPEELTAAFKGDIQTGLGILW